MKKMSYEIDGCELITPLRLKERVVGKHSIKVSTIKAGEPVQIVSIRNAIYAGLRPLRAKFDVDLRVHQLVANGDCVWTSDHPQELYTQGIEFKELYGRVLVGGLGIGMAATLIANRPGVEKVICVEIEKEIIELMKGQLPKTRAKIEVVKADLFEYLTDERNHFDSAYFDIWAPTGESAWMNYVVPLKRLVYRHHGPKTVRCWLEREMANQILQNDERALGMEKMIGEKEYKRWKGGWKPRAVYYAVADIQPKEKRAKLKKLYLEGVGTRAWEDQFGATWDSWKQD